jgi:hypothetical protein
MFIPYQIMKVRVPSLDAATELKAGREFKAFILDEISKALSRQFPCLPETISLKVIS